MKSKKLISLFLFLLLGVQTLPLQQIAAWLSSGQLKEEIAHNANPVKAKTGLDELDPAFDLHTLQDHLNILQRSVPVKNAGDERLIVRHAEDILTPPPNSGLFQL